MIGCWQHPAPGHSLECDCQDERPLLPTQKPTGRAFRSASLPCPAGRSYCRRYVHRPMDAAFSGPVGFCVGPGGRFRYGVCHDPALPLSYTRKVVGAARSTSGGDGNAAAYRSRRSARRRTPSVLRLHQHRSGPGLIPARLSLPFLACHAGVCSPRVPSHVHSCCVSFNAAASMLAPVFPGCHVICRPATYHGIEPPPFLPSLDKRAGIEPALSLLVAGGDPGFPLVMVIVQACPRRSRQPAIWHQVTSRITTAHSPTRSAADGWLTSPTYSPKRVTFTPLALSR